jgi:hypothetical protein
MKALETPLPKAQAMKEKKLAQQDGPADGLQPPLTLIVKRNIER